LRDPSSALQLDPVSRTPSRPEQPRLSKSRFVAGWQCPKLLWWTVHEPQAGELQPDKVLQDLFDQGRLVGERARAEWPGGVLIEGDHRDPDRVPRTRATIESGAPVIFEACFEADGVFCAVDVLEKRAGGWTLIEVKSSTEVKDYHLPDVAVQAHVARRSGLDVARIEVMHLNSQHRHPDQGPLFVREDVTARVQPIIHEVTTRIAEQRAALNGPLPDHPVGPHCWYRGSDKLCPFWGRCWPEDPDHIGNLYNVGPSRMWSWMHQSVHRMSDLPATAKLNDRQRRQLRAQREGKLIVERGLAEAIRPAVEARRLGFLDFETVGRAIPPWEGLGPWRQTAAQFSYHERGPDGEVSHREFLAEGPEDPSLPPDDPREPLARAMLDAAAHADLVVMYTGFESTRVKELAEHLPHLAEPLLALRNKLWDLLPVVADHVYHPDFQGSFSLKRILTPLVPELSYRDLVIVDGRVASVEIARLLFVSGRIPKAERDRTRRDLLEYCERDTFATVRLVERLAELAGWKR
jgi:hypothetical protein